jgi:23S rRNA pseudouridine2605 synthase
VSSRRKAEELIREGHVRVNDRIVTELGARADPAHDQIRVDGRPLRLPARHVYLMLHKPSGVVTTLADPQGRATVRDLLRGVKARVYPVGRLDYHSSGLLLLTDDGELAARLMHPRHEIERDYRVKAKGRPTPEILAQLRAGVRIDDRHPAQADVALEREQDGKAWLRLVLREGRHHEVRRMCLAVGLSVEKLRRVRYGPLELGRLPPGELRPLTEREVARLRRWVGLEEDGGQGSGVGRRRIPDSSTGPRPLVPGPCFRATPRETSTRPRAGSLLRCRHPGRRARA